jgi:pyruvate dehydrogenase E2 component (dihydrolipoamide acetyltransferase)
MPEVIMPKMGDAMEEGTLVRWIVSEGDEVNEGDPLAEIETDKVTIELEAESSGTLHELRASEGDSVPVGDAVAMILAECEEPPASSGASGGASASGEAGGEAGADDDSGDESGGGGTATATEATDSGDQAAATSGGGSNGSSNGSFRASPIVRRLARENDLDLSQVDGSGPAGRIVERDVRAAMESGTAKKAPESPAEDGQQSQPQAAQSGPRETQLPSPTGAEGTEILEASKMQKVIAERMQQSKQEVPHFYATVEVKMDAALALRKQLNAALEEQGDKLSVNDFVMKAVALGIAGYPKMNALYTSEGIELHETVNMAMAVALEAGLITPVIKDCAGKSLSAISRSSKDLAKRARDGKLGPDEYQGGTITVSNMGMFGVESFSAIINQPQSAIIAVSSIQRRPDFDEEDNVVAANMMKLTLSADHRIANGAEGAQYMAEVKRLLESPMLLVA